MIEIIYDFIKENQNKNIDSIDILIYLREIDINASIQDMFYTLETLQDDNKIKREEIGIRYRYVTI